MSRTGTKKFENAFGINEADTSRIDESIAEIAISKTSFGKFSLKVTAVSYLIYLNMNLAIISTGFLLTAAACHLQMNILDRGLISTAFFVGSCFSAVISGFTANLKGRKWILLFALFLQGIADFLISILSNYWIMFGLKFLSGAGSAGQSIVFTYLSECLPMKNRSFILSNMEYFSVFGHAFAAAIGLGIIPLEFGIEGEYFSFYSWNLYILICSVPSFILGFCLIFLPETPKYLADRGSREKLLQVLIEMYVQNVGKSEKEYREKLLNSENATLIELLHSKEETEDSNRKILFRTRIFNELRQLTRIFKPPFLKNTLLACLTAFTITFSSYALFLWLPEVFQRFANFEAENKGKNSNFCVISKGTFSSTQNTRGCDAPMDKKVFINNLILCSSCIPTIIVATLLVKRCGLKILIASLCILCIAVTIGIYFSNLFYENLILLCLYLSLTSTSVTFQLAYFVSIFPTSLRSSGVIVTSLLVRIGATFGNFLFSFLKDYCLYFILIICLVLLVATISTILIRERKDE